jgi:hypothetical protein
MTDGIRLWKLLRGKIMMLIFLMSACTPDPLEVKNIPALTPQIVVSSQIIPDQSVAILLTRTFGALDASDDSDPQKLLDQIAIMDATVSVSIDGNVYLLDSLGSGIYGGTGIPFTPGAACILNVRSESTGTVTATANVQSQVSFVQVTAELHYSGREDTLAQVTYTLSDPAEISNWYMLTAQRLRRKSAEENIIDPRAFVELVSDAAFDGKKYSDHFLTGFRGYKPGDTLMVSLANVSEEYYHFMQQRADNRFSLVEFLGEPANYSSNIDGGKGFFNLYVPDIRFFVLK